MLGVFGMGRRRSLSLVFAALLMAAMTSAAAASESADVQTTVQRFVNDFNVGTIKDVRAACEPSAIIIDNFPPHVWSGADACGAWFNAYNAMAAKNGITGEIVTLAKPWHVDVSGDRAYVVNPAKDTYLQRGKRVTFAASVFTVALKREPSGWMITGWAWSDH